MVYAIHSRKLECNDQWLTWHGVCYVSKQLQLWQGFKTEQTPWGWNALRASWLKSQKCSWLLVWAELSWAENEIVRSTKRFPSQYLTLTWAESSLERTGSPPMQVVCSNEDLLYTEKYIRVNLIQSDVSFKSQFWLNYQFYYSWLEFYSSISLWTVYRVAIVHLNTIL